MTRYNYLFTAGRDRIIQINRRGGAGDTLSISAGGSVAGRSNTDGGNLILRPGVPTGSGQSVIKLKRYGRYTTATLDNLNYDHMMIPSTKSLTDGGTAQLFKVRLLGNYSAGGMVSYTIRSYKSGVGVQAKSGLVSYAVANRTDVYYRRIG